MTIASIALATNEEWDSMVKAAESAIYFQTREWFEIWSEYSGFKNDARLITFESGRKVLLPLCYQVFLGGLQKIHFLAPKGTGGFVTNDILSDDEKRELFAVLRQLGTLYARFNPYDALTNEFDGYNETDSTQVVDLSGGFEQVFAQWAKGRRKSATKGLQEAITLEPVTTEDEWREFFSLYQESLARWGDAATNRYGWDLFQALFRKRASGIQLWLVRHEGQAVCGSVNLYHNRHVEAWLSGSSAELAKRLNATPALEYCMIKDACERGFLLYDVGPSGDLEDVANFKRGFATQSKTVHVYKSPLVKVSTAIRRGIRKHALTRPLMRGIGS